MQSKTKYHRKMNRQKISQKLLTICCLIGTIINCVDGAPSPASVVLPTDEIPSMLNGDENLHMALKRISEPNRIGNLTRNHGGDIFYVYDTPKCDTDTCIGLSSGTADIYKHDIKEIDLAPYPKPIEKCKCHCLPHQSTYREDLGICVDDIHECTLAPFVSGSSSERIPFVFLPLRGQIIHPSKEISFPGVQAPICAVSGSQFLSHNGWAELRSQIDADVPFRLFRDEGRTFLQWLGEPELRHRLQGRLVLVHLLCRDTTPPPPLPQPTSFDDHHSRLFGQSKQNDLISQPNIFTPCVAFRVVGTPIKFINNVTEVSFSSDTQIDPGTSSIGLSTKEYIVIGICSLILGLIYVASVFMYLHMKKRKNESHSGSMRNPKSEINYPKHDELVYGAAFSRSGSMSTYHGGQNHSSIIGGRTSSIGNESGRRSFGGGGGSIVGNGGGSIVGQHHRNHGPNMMVTSNMTTDELGSIVKSNPLLNHFPNMNENPGFMSDMSTSNSECDEEMARAVEKIKNMHQTSAMVHPGSKDDVDSMRRHDGHTPPPSQENERLPEENVSIVEDMSAEDKFENMRAIVSGTMRRKLYFNPAYFEPQLLQSPPAAAIEFLTKIREVITIAKYKMSTKRFQPSLNLIPEEYAGSETYAPSNARSSRRGSVISLKRENARHKSCTGCPGCEETKVEPTNCKNCGDKRNSIRKWLEGVSANGDSGSGSEPDAVREKSQEFLSELEKIKNRESDTSSSSDNDTIKANSVKSIRSGKGKAPPIPTNPPKVLTITKKGDNADDRHHMIKGDDRELINNKQKSTVEKIYAKSIETNEIYGRSSNNSVHSQGSHRNPTYDRGLELYHRLSKSGVDVFNNPQFKHTPQSPVLSQRSRGSQHSRKQHIEVLDQYANPKSIERRRQNMMRNIHRMPDMVYEALAVDYSKRNKDKNYGNYILPTPDYQTDEETKSRKSTSNYDDEDPYVPTPDYNTYGRVPKRPHYQPDSPIYSRKSPHYLIVDYETDSLERNASNKNRSSVSPPSGSMDSSQASPSLSSALPLEEEVEIRNAVYDRVEGFRKDQETLKNKINSIYDEVNFRGLNDKTYMALMRPPPLPPKPKPAKVKYDTPSQGSMTIEVDHNPLTDEISTDSDQFEPDTLDRKPKKNTSTLLKPKNDPRAQSIIKSTENLTKTDEYISYSNLDLSSLPDLNHLTSPAPQLILSAPDSIKNDSSTDTPSHNQNNENVDNEAQKSLRSLREIYEAKNQKNLQRPVMTNLEFDDKGRLLTLDARHSKRQRKRNDGSLKKLVPPDVVPYNRVLYKQPKTMQHTKNSSGWNTKNLIRQQSKDDGKETRKSSQIFEENEQPYETASNNSESNEVGSASETHNLNSDKKSQNLEAKKKCDVSGNDGSEGNKCEERSCIGPNHMDYMSHAFHKDYSNVNKLSKFNSLRKSPEAQEIISENNGCFINEMENNQPYGILENFITLGDVNNKLFLNNVPEEPKLFNYCDSNRSNSPDCESPNQKSNSSNNSRSRDMEDPDKIEILSSRSLSIGSNRSSSLKNNRCYGDPTRIDGKSITPTKVFRVEINQSTHGMQIALGLKDRAKKSKDMKNAWRRFMSIATSKFNSGKSESRNDSSDYYEKSVSDGASGRDDTTKLGNSADSKLQMRLSPKSELDSGYISADSNESKLQNKRYERYNFKKKGSNCSSNIYDVIEDSKNEVTDVDAKSVKAVTPSRINADKKMSVPPPPPPTIIHVEEKSYKHQMQPSSSVSSGLQPRDCILEIKDAALNVNVYSSDDEQRYSSGLSSDDDSGDNDGCESGAESIETHSVLFKNVRKIN